MKYYRKKSQRSENQTNWPQKWFRDKACKFCKTEFTPTSPCHLYCSVECETDGYTNQYLLRTYGVTLSWYKQKFEEQNGLCAICGEEGFLMNPKRHRTKLVVDHCHTTNSVRGLLCHNCNRALGLLKDRPSSLNRAILYLEGATTIESTSKDGSE